MRSPTTPVMLSRQSSFSLPEKVDADVCGNAATLLGHYDRLDEEDDSDDSPLLIIPESLIITHMSTACDSPTTTSSNSSSSSSCIAQDGDVTPPLYPPIGKEDLWFTGLPKELMLESTYQCSPFKRHITTSTSTTSSTSGKRKRSATSDSSNGNEVVALSDVVTNNANKRRRRDDSHVAPTSLNGLIQLSQQLEQQYARKQGPDFPDLPSLSTLLSSKGFHLACFPPSLQDGYPEAANLPSLKR